MNLHNDSFYKLTSADQIVPQTVKGLSATISSFVFSSKIVTTDYVLPTNTNNVNNSKLVRKHALKSKPLIICFNG